MGLQLPDSPVQIRQSPLRTPLVDKTRGVLPIWIMEEKSLAFTGAFDYNVSWVRGVNRLKAKSEDMAFK